MQAGQGIMASVRERALPWFRNRGRPNLLFEAILIIVAYWLYTLVRNGVPTQVAEATVRAYDLHDFEKQIGLAFERPINQTLADIDWLIIPINYYYATMHFGVTILVLIWLWRSHPMRYRGLRTVLYITNGVALIGFWLVPLAPPRFLPGFVDTVVHYDTWGSWASADVAEISNQYAAMPSMHAGWSLWCGLIIFVLSTNPWAKGFGVAYPLVTGFVVIATGNHFVLDIVGGWLALGVGFIAYTIVFRRPALPELWKRADPRATGTLTARSTGTGPMLRQRTAASPRPTSMRGAERTGGLPPATGAQTTPR